MDLKFMQRNSRYVIAIGVVLSFVLLVFFVTQYFDYVHESRESERLSASDVDTMTKEEIKAYLEQRKETLPDVPPYIMLPLISFAGIFIGTLVYYMMSEKITVQERSNKKNCRIILKLLNPEERKVVDMLVQNKGRIRQYELSYLPNLNKVKTHRVLKSLEQKGILHKEKLGKVNQVVLDTELYDILKK